MVEILRTGEQEGEFGVARWAGVPIKPRVVPFGSGQANYPVNLRHQNFESVVNKRAYAYSDFVEWQECADRIRGYYSDQVRPLLAGTLRDTEDESFDKMMVCWRVPGFGRLAFTADFESQSTSQAGQLRPYVAALGRKIVAQIRNYAPRYRETWAKAKVRIDKGKGAPFWQPATDRASGLALASITRNIQSFSSMRDELSSASGGIAMHMTMYRRIQQNRKDVVLCAVTGNEIVPYGMFRGPKVRTVKAPPFAENCALAGYYDVLKQVVTDLWPKRFVTEFGAIHDVLKDYRYFVASDASTFDDTIGLQTLQVMSEEVLTPAAMEMARSGILAEWVAKFAIDYEQLIEDRYIYSPACRMGEAARLLRMLGGVKSGERGTTIKDIIVMGSLCDMILASLAAHGVRADYICWGDDVLWYSNDARLRATFDKIIVGVKAFVVKVDADSSYLSRHWPEGYSYLGRQVGRRLNREPAEEPTSLLNAALAIRASYDTLQDTPSGVPHPAAHKYFPLLRACIPRLGSALDVAESATTHELMLAYAGSVEIGARGSRYSAIGDAGTEESDDEGLVGRLNATRATFSKSLKMELFAQYSEDELTKIANTRSIEEWIRVARGKY